MSKDRKRAVCPACGSLNNPKWEFCARCGESIRRGGVEPSAKSQAKAAPAGAPGSSAGFRIPWGLLAGVLALGAVGVYFVKTGGKLPEQRADPSLFVMATAPSQAPPPASVNVHSRPGDAEYREGRRLLAEGRTAEALPLLAQAVSDGPEVGDYHIALARALWDGKQTERALEEAAAAARLSPAYRLDQARYLAQAGRQEEAVRVYEAVLAADPNDGQALREAGAAYAALNEPGKALALMTRAAELRPGDPESQRGLGWALEKSGDVNGAVQAYEKTLALDPTVSSARSRLAELLVGQGRKEAALDVYREGLERDPGTPSLYREFGSLLDRLGRTKEAAAAYREYAKQSPNAKDAKGVLARANRLDPQPAVSPESGS